MTLLESIRERTESALAAGAVEPIATRSEWIDEDGISFIVRIAENLQGKDRATQSGRNPFLPYEDELFVRDVSPTHVALLNKFNVLDEHLLVVTRAFEEQESPLTIADFDALHRVLNELDVLFFYNSGPRAGASQRHKHLQFVPKESSPTPLEELYSDARRLPFAASHADLPDGPDEAHAVYLELLSSIGRPHASGPYNLLATRRRLAAVPRERESARGIAVNALGFAGALLVRGASQLAVVREAGPLTILREVGSAH